MLRSLLRQEPQTMPSVAVCGWLLAPRRGGSPTMEARGSSMVLSSIQGSHVEKDKCKKPFSQCICFSFFYYIRLYFSCHK